MSQYTQRDAWDSARFARLVRNDHEFWVEWVTLISDEETFVEVRHAATPALAVQAAYDALADLRHQVATKAYRLGESAAPGAQRNREYVEKDIYVPFRWSASGTAPLIMVGYIEGTFDDVDAVITQSALAYLVEYERQLGELPDISSQRWMLIE